MYCNQMKYEKTNKTRTTKILFGLGWTTISTIVNGLSQILRLSILARFLEKEDFGIVAILTFILGLTQVFSDMGFSAAIMSEKDLSRQKFVSLYWLQFITFNGFAIIIGLFSPLIAYYYSEPSLTILLPLMLTELFFLSIGKLYDTVLQKAMKFRVIAIRNIISAVFSLLLAVVLAILDFGVYSLVLSTVFHALLVNVWNVVRGQKEYKLSFERINFGQVSELLRVGFYQMGTQIVDYLAAKLDILIISTFIGIGALGIYNLAKELVLKFVMVINVIVSKVMLPVLSDCQDNVDELKRTFMGFIKRLSLLNTPILGFLFLFAPIIVDILYGNGYEDAVDIVRIMSIWSLFVVLNSPNGMIAIVVKRTDISFVYTILRFIIIGALLYSFARNSVKNAAITMLLAYVVMFFVNWFMLLYKVLRIRLIDYLKLFYKSWIAVFIATGLLYLMSRNIFKDDSLITSVVLAVIYLFLFLLYLLLFESQILKSFKTSFTKTLRVN